MNRQYLAAVMMCVLSACGGGSGSEPAPSQPSPPTFSVNGAVQKGPFLVGSTVWINARTATGGSTNSTIIAEIRNSIGDFSFNATTPGPVQIVATGYYFNELTGQISSGTLTLRALYEVTSAPKQSAYVNIMTHLINDRALELISTGQMTLQQAIAKAEGEFIRAFNYALPVTGVENFSALNVYGAGGTSNAGHAYLLALSTAFYKYASIKAQRFGTVPDAELTLILNTIADDLEDDGQIQTPDFLDEFVAAVRSLDPERIVANLRNRSMVDYPTGLDVPDISKFLSLCAGTPGCAWRAGAPMPQPARSIAAVTYNGKVYAFGGTNSESLRSVTEYDPAKNQWTSKASLPDASFDMDAHVVGTHIYVLAAYGSGGFMNQLWRYDPAANSWETMAPKPTYRYQFASAVLNGRIYVIAGHGTLDNGPWQSGKPWEIKNLVEIYDVASNSWSTGQPSPLAFMSAASCVFDNQIYVFGGRNAASELQSFTLVFNPSTNGWSTRSPNPAIVDHGSCVAVNDRFYLIGGSMNSSATNRFDRYDPSTDTWTSPTRLPTPRYWAGTSAVGSKLVIFGGQGANNSMLSSTEIFDTAAL